MSAATSVSSAVPSTSRRDEAGPLPPKVGELSYFRNDTSNASSAALPDTEGDIADAAAAAAYAANNDSANRSSSTSASRNAITSSAASTTTATTAAASTTSLPAKQLPWYKRIFSAKAGPLVGGFRGPSLVRFFGILGLMGLAATTWALGTQRLAKTVKDAENKEEKSSTDQMAAYMGLFLHVAFAIAILVLLIFLERCVFVLRAERWIHKHPGEALPLHRGGRHVPRPSQGGLAPWNRPPLPTYAAALGYRGTGDVEDEAIASNPPPAYGNTRGSVLLLASAALRRISNTSVRASNRLSQLRSPMSPRTPRTPGDFQQIPESRPVSYISTEGLQDIERAHQLEMSLARLEAGPSGGPASLPTSRQ